MRERKSEPVGIFIFKKCPSLPFWLSNNPLKHTRGDNQQVLGPLYLLFTINLPLPKSLSLSLEHAIMCSKVSPFESFSYIRYVPSRYGGGWWRGRGGTKVGIVLMVR